MRLRRLCSRSRLAVAALTLLAVLALPVVRHALEASMARHMLVQFPLLMLAGALMAGALSARARRVVAEWNAYGISGLVAVALALALLMIPRLLDLALVDGYVELAKCAALVLAGAALRLSWRPAGLLVQGFFLGNVLPMTAVIGQLYVDSPARVCNAYLLDDQIRLGQMLVWLTAIVAVGWLVLVVRALIRRETAAAPAVAAARSQDKRSTPAENTLV